jgi:hypothetical protein
VAVDEDSLPVGTTTERLDTTKITQADGSPAHREAVLITDPEKAGHRANVTKTVEKNGRYAQMVSDENTRGIAGALGAIYEQNERIIMLLTSMAE